MVFNSSLSSAPRTGEESDEEYISIESKRNIDGEPSNNALEIPTLDEINDHEAKDESEEHYDWVDEDNAGYFGAVVRRTS